MDRNRIIVRAAWIAVVGNALLAAMKIIVGIYADSLAVLSDGIDSGSDVFTSLITLFTARIISKPPDVRFPFGYGRADTVAAKALSFIIFFAGAQLAISTARLMLIGETPQMPENEAVYVTLLSIAGKLLLAWFLLRVGAKRQSAMLKANGKNMRNDVIISVSVLVGLVFTFIFELPVLDRITALIVSAWIMKVGFQLFMENSTELMDGITDKTLYERLFEAVSKVKEAQNPHRVRIRKLAEVYLIDMDVEVKPDLSIAEAHDIAHQVEDAVRQALPQVYDVMIHVEPVGSCNCQEKFGLSPKDIP